MQEPSQLFLTMEEMQPQISVFLIASYKTTATTLAYIARLGFWVPTTYDTFAAFGPFATFEPLTPFDTFAPPFLPLLTSPLLLAVVPSLALLLCSLCILCLFFPLHPLGCFTPFAPFTPFNPLPLVLLRGGSGVRGKGGWREAKGVKVILD